MIVGEALVASRSEREGTCPSPTPLGSRSPIVEHVGARMIKAIFQAMLKLHELPKLSCAECRFP